MLTQLTEKMKNYWRECRQKSSQEYRDYLEFWRNYYDR
jgi:hypothetical protein